MAKKIFEDGKEVANFEVDFLPSDLPKEKEKEDEEQARRRKRNGIFEESCAEV